MFSFSFSVFFCRPVSGFMFFFRLFSFLFLFFLFLFFLFLFFPFLLLFLSLSLSPSCTCLFFEAVFVFFLIFYFECQKENRVEKVTQSTCGTPLTTSTTNTTHITRTSAKTKSYLDFNCCRLKSLPQCGMAFHLKRNLLTPNLTEGMYSNCLKGVRRIRTTHYTIIATLGLHTILNMFYASPNFRSTNQSSPASRNHFARGRVSSSTAWRILRRWKGK